MASILARQIDLKQVAPNKYTTSWDDTWTVGDSESRHEHLKSTVLLISLPQRSWAAASWHKYITRQQHI